MGYGSLIMVTGGARSGKSRLAEELAAAGGEKVVYLATATVDDAEMAARVDMHRRRRPAAWLTVEAPLAVTEAVAREGRRAGTILLDSLGMWLSNLLSQEAAGAGDSWEKSTAAVEAIMVKVRELAAVARQVPARVIIVTEEAGMGLIPPYPLGRVFRDLLGLANQEIARRADQVYLVVAGLPLVLKDNKANEERLLGGTSPKIQ
ncbi:MAG: adenosylcobinamide kinase / adenosylcobinamide-phosphate guanylyltransferase [Moorella sp. (in: firmicutes)]|jgi:adenosylcobinamide kinase/adenosylcobinamide-phosphate guanylyltransferase|uniref:bifunctional adenosylcobinamide kinase/adenosylcobinamide-phosphate guanylyltransferase n=1 Tax=unclassified Neomoorella TaxID=2676739 RepID=UPI0010FFB5C3|nr:MULTISPECIES: bifunctional adenosylcobinamide kinase/adenosylcobinamide-phosphate guanylyltransferase [unclassified Moorella (in: firmicutes)]MDK2815439.1 adenosylcobinamide kinase / adenosylcobinamide-phosphate guanylyltransferase [Moorella sp. (in: firmicutes)]MDK2894396.1 adenosylcobinamide kinase / adenosylcobinamide-phosphate guanylyltransferase [Moorella sp. (in: firmicutes)]GEA15291.1 adenosylcobinamide kinase/adenosylcobinamide phosphate guanyltransferase [Moorella sp. E308F]GEA19848